MSIWTRQVQVTNVSAQTFSLYCVSYWSGVGRRFTLFLNTGQAQGVRFKVAGEITLLFLRLTPCGLRLFLAPCPQSPLLKVPHVGSYS